MDAALTVSRLMGTLGVKAPEAPGWFPHILVVTLDPDLLHQILQEDADVPGVDAGRLHRTIVAHLTLLMEGLGLGDALPV